jgi:hypothetical protein
MKNEKCSEQFENINRNEAKDFRAAHFLQSFQTGIGLKEIEGK